MGKKLLKTLLAFIEDIPDSKLEGGFPSIPKRICNDDNYRLDMQSMTSGEPRCYNLQVQVNKQALFTSARQAGKNGASVAMVLVPVENPFSAATVKEKFKKSVLDHAEKTGRF